MELKRTLRGDEKFKTMQRIWKVRKKLGYISIIPYIKELSTLKFLTPIVFII